MLHKLLEYVGHVILCAVAIVIEHNNIIRYLVIGRDMDLCATDSYV